MERIGFVGLGHMGGSMAARYLDAGYAVTGTARDRASAQWLVEKGMRWFETPREISETADVVVTSLPNDAVVRSVASGERGLVAGLAAGKVWADMSTISPQASRELAAEVRDTGSSAAMLDAPVSGSVPQVEQGTLIIMVGGDQAAYERVEPVLRVLGTPTRVGDNGQGLTLKLAINISLAVQLLAFCEGLLLAERDGIDPHLAADVMTRSPIGSPMLKARVPLILDKPDETWFDIGLMHKDIRLALAAGRTLDAPLPSTTAVEHFLARATGLGYEHDDIAASFRVLSQLASGNSSAPMTRSAQAVM
jgi:3-hydroxyisobutyrate dehydrogenase-like beta-hydroxyacid dehydrogenase